MSKHLPPRSAHRALPGLPKPARHRRVAQQQPGLPEQGTTSSRLVCLGISLTITVAVSSRASKCLATCHRTALTGSARGN
eukprot:9042794-Alexandrium_andersonii.AAC.1